jgi:hypothetical protein
MGSGLALDLGVSAFSPPWAGNVPAGVPSTGVFGPTTGDHSVYDQSSGSGSFLSALNPLTAFGMTVLAGVIAFGLLLVIRHTLPA